MNAVPGGLTAADIRRLFDLLDTELARGGVEGEVYVVGGAVMCLALHARPATRDVDGYFRPARVIREAAARVAAETGMPVNWLNDAVKGYLSPKGDFEAFLELPNLAVFTAHPAYLLAMKCAAARLGEEFHDVDDIRYLLRHLGIESAAQALAVVLRYFDENQIQPKTRLLLEEILGQ